MPAIGSSKSSERGLQAAIKARKPAPPARKSPETKPVAPVKGIGPTAGKYGGKPAPRLPTGPLQKTFAPLGKQVGAPSNLAPQKVQHEVAEHERLQKAASVFNKLFDNVPSARALSKEEHTRGIGIVAPPFLSKIPGFNPAVAGLAAGTVAEKSGLTKGLPGEAASLATMPFLGTLAAGKAGIQAAGGNTKPLEQLGKGFAQGAVGEALQGHFGQAAHLAKEKPLLSATELAGVESIVGRAGGAAVRAAGSTAEAAGARGALARAGSFVRPPVALTDEAALAKGGYVRQREYSKDILRKGVQVAADKRREPITTVEHPRVGPRPVEIQERGRTVSVLKGTPKEQARFQKNRANFESGTTQAKENVEREQARRISSKIEGHLGALRTWIAPQRVGEAITRLTAGGVIKTVDSARADVQKYVDTVRTELKNPENYRNRDELQQAQQHAEMLQKALDNPKVHWESAVQKGLEYGRALKQGDVRLKESNIYEPHELEHGALSEYALSHMNVTYDHVKGLVDARGEPVSVKDIEAHALKEGRSPETLGYVPHAVKTGRPGAYHQPLKIASRPVTPGQSRQGIILRRGGMAMDTQVLKDELTRKKVVSNNAEAVDRVIGQASVTKPNGDYYTPKGGAEAADRLTRDTGTPWVAVRAVPAKLDPATQKSIKDAQDPVAMETAHLAMLNNRIVNDLNISTQTPNVVLMPASHVQALLDHLKTPGNTEKLLQMLNGPFRMAVLPQPRWITGNFIEPYFIRLPLSGAGVNIPGSAVDFSAASKSIAHMEHSGDPEMVRAAGEIKAMQKGGLFIGRRGASVHRTWEQFSGPTAERLYAAHVVRNLPVLKHAADLLLTVPHTIFHLNRVIESTAQGIALGKSVRNDVHAITGSWLQTLKISEKAMDQVTKGMVNTATQHRFMEKQYELLGQYAGFRPEVRRLVQTALPFIPWTLNSIRFSYWTLPAHHTAAFAALARLGNSVQAEWEAEHKNVPPGELKYAVKRADEGNVNVGRYTPFAAPIAVKEGDYGNFISQAFPQLQGSAEALRGREWTGKELQVPKTKSNPKGKATTGQKLSVAVNSFLESVIPGMAIGKRLREGGSTGYATSTILSPQVKPGTKHQSALSRTLNPFAPSYLKQPKGKTSPLKEGYDTGPAKREKVLSETYD